MPLGTECRWTGTEQVLSDDNPHNRRSNCAVRRQFGAVPKSDQVQKPDRTTSDFAVVWVWAGGHAQRLNLEEGTVTAIIRGQRRQGNAENGPPCAQQCDQDHGPPPTREEAGRAVLGIHHPDVAAQGTDPARLLSDKGAGMPFEQKVLQALCDFHIDRRLRPAAAQPSSTAFRSDSGKRTYSIAARRVISPLVLNHLKGLVLAMPRR